jgi:acetate---CoA ligase (ADP-forming)
MTRDLTGLFSPRSIAIIGASDSPEKVGSITLKNIIVSGFKGKIYPVNPKVTNIGSLKFYPNVASLPEVPDLAVVAVPAAIVASVIEEIGQKRITNVLVFSAGYKEIGPEGVKLESELVALAQKYKLNLLGPNCLGFANNELPVNVTFGKVINNTGSLRLISQSGAIAAALFDWCEATGLGFKDFITVGNKAVLNENDILEFWSQEAPKPLQDNTGLSPFFPIGLYLESIAHGPEFISIARKISQNNPIFMLKPGKSAGALKAMHSHTGAIAGEDNVLDAALRAAGIIRCAELGDFFDVARTFAWENVPIGPKVAVITNAGGPAVLSTDTINSLGLELAEFSDDTKNKLSECLPRMASFVNPVDVLGDALADRFGQALEIVLQEKTVQSVVVILTPQLMTQIEKTAEIIGTLSHKYSQPILCSFIGGGVTANGEKVLNNYRIPSFPFPERAIKTISLMWQWQSWRNQQSQTQPSPSDLKLDATKINAIISSVKSDHRSTLNNLEANDLIAAIGIPTPETITATDATVAQNFAKKIGFPVVLKISSPKLLHKTDVGGVIANINSPDEFSVAWNKIGQVIEGLDPEVQVGLKIQVQKQIGAGVEVIVGVKHDSIFGPVLLFGAGGKLAELVVDRNLHLLPITTDSAKKLMSESKVYPILSGYRGDQPYNIDQLADILVRISRLVETTPDISEIEINPVVITRDGAQSLDANVILKESTPNLQFLSAKVVSHEILASKFHRFVLHPDVPLAYEPGQFISVKINDQKINAYSIAGSIDADKFEVLVDTSPGGPGSIYFTSLNIGDTISYRGPFGHFIFKSDDQAEHILFLGTGSGCSPLRCILESALIKSGLTKPITFYFGLRFQNDIFWTDHFKKLEEQYPNFKYKLVLSKPGDDWTGYTGHLTDFVKKEFANASKCSAYICGNKAMVEEATQILLQCGCPTDRIYQERY